MVAIGLGKAEGARFVHRLGARGYLEVLPEWAGIAIREAPVAYGLAIVENAAREAAVIEGVEPEAFYETDARLLKIAKGTIPRLPFEQIDVLAIETLGKNISGTGMDPAVTARHDIRGRPNPPAPLIHKLAVLGLTPETHGNGLGVGAADFMTKEVADALDLYAMYMNAWHRDIHREGAHPHRARQRQGRTAGRRRHLLAPRRRRGAALPDPFDPASGPHPGLAAARRRTRRRRHGAGRSGAAPLRRPGPPAHPLPGVGTATPCGLAQGRPLYWTGRETSGGVRPCRTGALRSTRAFSTRSGRRAGASARRGICRASSTRRRRSSLTRSTPSS